MLKPLLRASREVGLRTPSDEKLSHAQPSNVSRWCPETRQVTLTFFFKPSGMLLGSGYIPLLNFSFMRKLMRRPPSPPIKFTPSQPSGNDKSNFHSIGDLETNPSTTGCFLIESASSEGMSRGLRACSLRKREKKSIKSFKIQENYQKN